MVNSNANAIGIIFPNSYDNLVPELAGDRLMASIPFAGRYRIIDFLLSSLANCGISNIAIVVRENYHSLMDHLGSGRAWDLLRKNGGLSIFPPYAEKNMKVYSGRVEALESILPYLKSKKEKYVIMMDANIAVDFDFNAMLAEHIESGADVTVAYTEQEKSAILKELDGKKATVQRSKGLGENDPEMMWMTTMNPETRRLIKVMPEDAARTAEVFDLLLGDNLAGRKDHIAENGYKYLDQLDVS